jgi:hypothetical protein
MIMKKYIIFIFYLLFLSLFRSYGQDTLPNFTVLNAGNNRIIIGWVNPFDDVKQISIQRSFDSITGYKSILTVADPASKENGYVDAKATNDHMFYRLYIQRDKGYYVFAKARKPFKDSATVITSRIKDTIVTLTIRGKDTIIAKKVDPFGVKMNGFSGVDSIQGPNPGNGRPKMMSFTPSLYVFTHRDGYVKILLPEEEKPEKYSLKFFEEDGSILFELKEIKERSFKIDKTNFYHAGWFWFELYEDGKLFEKHKFYLEKDF